MKFINRKKVLAITALSFAMLLCLYMFISINSARVLGLSAEETAIFSQNNLIGWDPNECIDGGGAISGVCGDTAQEIYWSALRNYFDEVHAAAIIGNIISEGTFGPTRWEIGKVVTSDGGSFKRSWDSLYNCNQCSVGVGSFGLTYNLGTYLHYVNDNFPDLLKYFQDAQYSYPGDMAIQAIGDNDYRRLAEMEVKYVVEKELPAAHYFNMDEFLSKTDVGEAAQYFSMGYERCSGGCLIYGSPKNIARAAIAKKVYDEMKDFSCSGAASSVSSSNGVSSASSTQSSSDQITWIGDSYSVQANTIISSKFLDVDFGPGSIGSDTSYVEGCKFVSQDGGCGNPNPSCLNILENIISQDNLRPVLVMACGTNGGWSDSDITKFKSLLDSTDSQAVVVNSKTPIDDYTDSNNLLKKLADSSASITLADWAAVYKEEYFEGDSERIHPMSNGGYEVWVGAIASALNGITSDGCTTFQGEYPNYQQGDDRWGGNTYGPPREDNGEKRTIKTSGCGLVSMAMIATVAAGQDIFPDAVAETIAAVRTDEQSFYNKTVGSGMVALDKIVGDKYGFAVESVSFSGSSDAKEKVRQYLKDGYMIHTSGIGNGTRPFYGEHYLALFDINDNDEVLVGDSEHAPNEWYPIDTIVDGMVEKNSGIFSAIPKSGGNSTCSNLCKTTTSSGAIDGGLTEDQAQKLADYYNSPQVSTSILVGNRKDNCVSFSLWFLNAFTDITGEGYGNGQDVVSGLQAKKGVEIGSEPRPFSVFSNRGGQYGHTGIVVGVNGDEIITVEAHLGNKSNAIVHKRSVSEYFNLPMPFAYTDGHIDLDKLNQIIGK